MLVVYWWCSSKHSCLPINGFGKTEQLPAKE